MRGAGNDLAVKVRREVNFMVTSADFIIGIEKASLGKQERVLLLKDMSDLLDKINEMSNKNDEISVEKNSELIVIRTLNYYAKYANNRILFEEWTKNSKALHRDNDMPAQITYHQSGQIQSEKWFNNNRYHRNNGNPALIYYYLDGKISSKSWYLDGMEHRDGGEPAYVSFYADGALRIAEWWMKGQPYRAKGAPTQMNYRNDGSVVGE